MIIPFKVKYDNFREVTPRELWNIQKIINDLIDFESALKKNVQNISDKHESTHGKLAKIVKIKHKKGN